jgi:hypothetical protein
MFANAAAPQLDESKHGLAAASATLLSRLQLRTTLIAKHCFSSRAHTLLSMYCTDASTHQFRNKFSVLSRLNTGSVLLRTENRELRTHQKRKGHPATWAAFSFKGE